MMQFKIPRSIITGAHPSKDGSKTYLTVHDGDGEWNLTSNQPVASFQQHLLAPVSLTGSLSGSMYDRRQIINIQQLEITPLTVAAPTK